MAVVVVVYGGPKVDKAQSIPSLGRLKGACWMTLGRASKPPSKRARTEPSTFRGEGGGRAHAPVISLGNRSWETLIWVAMNLIFRIGTGDFNFGED